jgi:hypothetical protein
MVDGGLSAIEWFGRHVVSILGTYVIPKDADRATFASKGVPPEATRLKFAYTGLPAIVDGRWYIVTAGHILERHLPAIQDRLAFSTGCSIADCFGPIKTGNLSFPFDMVDACEYWIHNPKIGLDYAMLKLQQNHADLLKGNGIVPYLPSQELFTFASRMDHLLLLGFPEENTELLSVEPGGLNYLHVQPSMLPVERSPNTEEIPYPRLKGVVKDRGSLKSIVGMSGGPIFATESNGTGYTVAGIQSCWLPRSNTIFGTNIESIIRHFTVDRHQNTG